MVSFWHFYSYFPVISENTTMNENVFNRHAYQPTVQVTEGHGGDIKWKIWLYFNISKKI